MLQGVGAAALRYTKNLYRGLTPASNGFLLPTVIVLGLAISTISVLTIQTLSFNSTTLNDQYFSALAREAAQAGVSAAAACIRSGNIAWSTANRTLTPGTKCDGQPGQQTHLSAHGRAKFGMRTG